MSSYIWSLFRIMICFLPVYCAARMMWSGGKAEAAKDEKVLFWIREILLAFFFLHTFGLLTLTFQNGQEWMRVYSFEDAKLRITRRMGVNFKPFHTIRSYLKYAGSADSILVNIVGNMVMFIPWGMNLPMLFKKYQSVIKVTVLALLLPICIEFVQLFIGRSVDVDDVILNFTGAMFGALIYWVLRCLIPGVRKLAW